jgi:hypothetical protein
MNTVVASLRSLARRISRDPNIHRAAGGFLLQFVSFLQIATLFAPIACPVIFFGYEEPAIFAARAEARSAQMVIQQSLTMH